MGSGYLPRFACQSVWLPISKPWLTRYWSFCASYSGWLKSRLGLLALGLRRGPPRGRERVRRGGRRSIRERRRGPARCREAPLRLERGTGVIVARVPEHPAGAAGLVGAPHLGLHLTHAEHAPVEGVIPEVLEPRPYPRDRVARALPDEPDALAPDLVRVGDRVPEARDAQVVARRVDHGADVVEARRQLLDPLPDVGVILVERGVAEDIGRHEGAGRAELSAGMLEESRDRRQPRVLVVWPGVTCGAELAVGREPHVVELYLVETVADRLLRDRDVVGPDLFPERIDPGEVLAVDPGLARAPVGDGQVGPAGGG